MAGVGGIGALPPFLTNESEAPCCLNPALAPLSFLMDMSMAMHPLPHSADARGRSVFIYKHRS